MGKAKADDEVTAKCSRPVCRGTEDGTEETDRQSKLGDLSTEGRPDGENISRREGSRVSDEVIVSVDLAGQQNPLASPGPLDGSVLSEGESADWLKGLLRLVALSRDLDFNRV